jgi:F-type H+-transporting ATPase subunit a
MNLPQLVTAGADRIDIAHHLLDSPVFLGLDLSHWGITKHVWMMWIAAALLVMVMAFAARQRGPIPRGLRGVVEPVLLFIRDDIARPNLHDAADRYLPYLWSVFFFILFCNLLGLVPGAATATGNLSVTAALALISFFMIHFTGVRQNGFFGYLRAIVPPVPWWLWPLLLVVEIIGILAKPFALAVRLWANMSAGHIVILVLLGFIFLFKNAMVVGISIAGATAIYMLEIFVGVLQAYVFTFLTAVFMGMAAHPEH